MAESPSCPRGAQGLHRNKPVRNSLGHGLRVSSQVLMDTWDCGQSCARQHPPTCHHLWGSAAMEQPHPPMPRLSPGVGQEPLWRDRAVPKLWDDPTIPVSGRPCPEVMENPKAPWRGRCSSSWLVPSGKTSTTRPTARSWTGAPMSSTLSECCGPEPPFLWGEGMGVSGDGKLLETR